MTTFQLPKAPCKRSIAGIAIHCSATPPTADWSVKDIDRAHRLKGWKCIGYHFVIRRNGEIQTGRNWDQIGAHVEGHNFNTLGICLVGGVDKGGSPENNFTPAQWESLEYLVLELRKRFPLAFIRGHNEFPKVAKACPSFSVRDWLFNLHIDPE